MLQYAQSNFILKNEIFENPRYVQNVLPQKPVFFFKVVQLHLWGESSVDWQRLVEVGGAQWRSLAEVGGGRRMSVEVGGGGRGGRRRLVEVEGVEVGGGRWR